MDRRGFLKFLGAGVAGIAIAEAVPLGRVWSFPSKIVVPPNIAVPLELNQQRIVGECAGFDFVKEVMELRELPPVTWPPVTWLTRAMLEHLKRELRVVNSFPGPPFFQKIGTIPAFPRARRR